MEHSEPPVAPMPISWSARSVPLRPAAILGQGEVVPVLARALADAFARGIDLDVHASNSFLLAVGDESELPWVDAGMWLGRDGPLLIPTTLEPSLDSGLLARAIARRIGASNGWIILLPDRILTGERSVGVADLGRLREIAAISPV